MPNRRSRNFGRQLLDDLKEATNNMRDFVFTSTFKKMKILDPQVSWRGASTEEIWGADPVHPSVAGYSKLAAGVVQRSGPVPTALRLGTGPAACTTDRGCWELTIGAARGGATSVARRQPREAAGAAVAATRSWDTPAFRPTIKTFRYNCFSNNFLYNPFRYRIFRFFISFHHFFAFFNALRKIFDSVFESLLDFPFHTYLIF
jgi:hypothetical protein